MTYVKRDNCNLPALLPKWDSAEAMQAAVDQYFIDCAERDEPATVTGLALALDFTNRHALLRYEAGETTTSLPDDVRAALSHTVKRAKARIEAQREVALYQGKVNPIGTIFSLKNNFGWIDRVEHEGGNQFTIQLVNFDPSQLPGPTSRTSIVMDQSPAIDVQPVPRIAMDVTHDGETVGNGGE